MYKKKYRVDMKNAKVRDFKLEFYWISMYVLFELLDTKIMLF